VSLRTILKMERPVMVVRSASAQPPHTESQVLGTLGLTKAFGATRALTNCSIALRPGEVHCIVGENGSGKSTLVKILSGVQRPDAGEITLAGNRFPCFASPRKAAAAGIATVFQEVLVVDARSVVENVWLGIDGVLRANTPNTERRARAEETLTALLGTAPPLNLAVERLSLADRQACCLARGLVRDPKILILDEATSALDLATRDRLFGLIRELTARGTAVVFISHRMDEIAEIGDRCSVMRSGETVATLDRTEASPNELIRLMTGADHLTADAGERPHRTPGEVVLDVPGLRLRAGELVGLAGLEGHGQDGFLKSLRGIAGAAYVARERGAESLFESKSVRENFGLATMDQDRSGPLLRPARTRARLSQYVERLKIRLGGPDDPITTLSGGSQQKVVIARWLASHPRVLLLNDPTRGIDIRTKRDLYELLLELTTEGIAVVMLSSEVDEHVELMDRVLVFREGEIATELPRSELSRQSLIEAFFG
jgi:ABC-type sugar transport system ATPase subunit